MYENTRKILKLLYYGGKKTTKQIQEAINYKGNYYALTEKLKRLQRKGRVKKTKMGIINIWELHLSFFRKKSKNDYLKRCGVTNDENK